MFLIILLHVYFVWIISTLSIIIFMVLGYYNMRMASFNGLRVTSVLGDYCVAST